jgi:hypothetical protein
MSDFDFNVKFIGGKTQLGQNQAIIDRLSENPGLILESRYIGKKQVNEIVVADKKPTYQPTENVVHDDIISNNPPDSKASFFATITNKFNLRSAFSYLQQPNVWYKSSVYIGVFASLAIIVLILSVVLNKPSVTNAEHGQVAGISEKKEQVKNTPTEAYKAWITDQLGVYAPPDGDNDGDQLTNQEEFLIGTDPKNAHTCNPAKTDAENLVEFINPITCKPIDVNDQVAMDKFSQIIDFRGVKSKVIQNNIKDAQPTNTKASTQENSLLGLFGISSLQSLNKQVFNDTKLKSELDSIKTKQSYIDKINKIDQYIKETRSLEPQDRNVPTPVNGAVFLEVSFKYNVPLKYVLALAQRESRFGTDMYDKNGNLTRPGKYKNMYSIGLDDSGNNVGFETWEDGVESFGRWYKKYQDRGISDCAKWRIYNPNGDYCKNVEETASQIDYYLSK